MATADVPSSSSIPNLEKYDVFLSFRCEDTRRGFTSHLYAALLRKHIKTFKDDYDLKRGDEIKPELLVAIERSKISVVIFSKNYASSSWCLAELAHIIKCHKNDRKPVIPVFYDVDPSHIRNQQGSFKDAFVRHEQRFNNDTRVQDWRQALCEAANLSGFDSKASEFRDDSAFVEEIVEDILRKLNNVPVIDDFEGLIGIEVRIEKIISLLSLDSPNTRMVGIWGIGGLGKTTLADKVFNKLSGDFKSRCFLADVREESEKNGLSNLLLKLVRALLEDKNIDLKAKSLPHNVKERLRRTKVLVVLDDVNDLEQLEVLLGDNCLRFCKGSRIIITTRNKEVLKGVEDVETYEVAELSDDEAIRLFESTAFRGNSPAPSYRKLTDEVVKYAGGIPLVINLLATRFRSMQREGISWQPILNELKQSCRGNIEEKLKISYDGLNDEEKAMFLNIACFFKGKEREFVEGILDGCGSARIRMDNLIDKSFITIKPSDDRFEFEIEQDLYHRIEPPEKSICMHDLLQDFGQRLGKCSRLCTVEDAYRVLNNDEGTGEIEGIFLNHYYYQFKKVLHLRPEVFRKMWNLRLLVIRTGVGFLNQDLQFLPRSLRYIYWRGYPSKCFPSNFEPINLVELHMPYSELEQLWDGIQDLDKLKCINLRNSINLKQIPDLSRAPNLERIYLEGCEDLVEVPWNTLRSNKLIELNLRGCWKHSSTLPERIFAPSTLKIVRVQGSNVKITGLPETISRGLVSLNLRASGIQSLPSSIGSLENLTELILNHCESLSNIPSSIQLPRNLETLDLGWTAIKEISSSSIENCSSLQEINLQACKMIESLPSNIFELRSLRRLNLNYCSNLKSLPEISKAMESLQNLGELNLEKCAKLESIPDSICNLTSLRTLVLRNCENLRSIPELPLSLIALDASRCTSLERVSSSKRVLRQWFRSRHESHTNGVTLDYRNFFECLKMDQNSRDEILSDYQLRVLAKAIIQDKLNPRDDSTVVFYPGNEISKWFDHQSEGSSHTIALTPQWHNANFLGFAFCIVIDGKAYGGYSTFMELNCAFNFKNRDTEEVCSFYWSVSQVPQQLVLKPFTLNSDNLFLWYQPQDYNNCHDAVEVSLEFSLVSRTATTIQHSTKVVKRCGIHMLYCDDRKDMEIDYECDAVRGLSHLNQMLCMKMSQVQMKPPMQMNDILRK